MSKTRIFVSSTYFDLAQVRDDLYTTISGLGHTPIMSEFPSFRVLPDLTAVENCRRNVRENTDIFVLIVGTRRGSLDPASEKPITNIEYDTAISCGLDVFVFVNDAVLTLLPTWEKNPIADFSATVDSPDVFAFVKRIRESQKWTFSFRRASDISEILKTQLSAFLKYLLDRKTGRTIDPLPEFNKESLLARSLSLERPQFWEHKLTAELIRARFAKTERRLRDLERGLIIRQNRNMDRDEYFRWILERLADLEGIVNAIAVAWREEIPASWGPPGVSGKPLEILEAVQKLGDGCYALADWEAGVTCVHPPDECLPMKVAITGSARDTFTQVSAVLTELDKAIEEMDRIAAMPEHERSAQRVINVQFTLEFTKVEVIKQAASEVAVRYGLSH